MRVSRAQQQRVVDNNKLQHFAPITKGVPRKSIASRGVLNFSNEKNVVMQQQQQQPNNLFYSQQQQQQSQQMEKEKFTNNPKITLAEAIGLISYRLGVLENKVNFEKDTTTTTSSISKVNQVSALEFETVIDRLTNLEKEIPENLANKIVALENHIFRLNELYAQLSQCFDFQEEEEEEVTQEQGQIDEENVIVA